MPLPVTHGNARHSAQAVAEAALRLAHLHAFATRPAHLDIDRHDWPEYRRHRLDLARDLIDFRRLFADLGGTTLAELDAAVDPEALVWHPPTRPTLNHNGWTAVERESAPEMFRAVACQLLGRVVYERALKAVRHDWPMAWQNAPSTFHSDARDRLRRRYGPRVLERWIP